VASTSNHQGAVLKNCLQMTPSFCVVSFLYSILAFGLSIL